MTDRREMSAHRDVDRPWGRLAGALLLVSGLIGVAAAPATGQTEPRSFTLAAAGDVLVHGRVADIARANSVDPGGYDFWPMFEAIEPWVSSADFSICHLESVLSSTNTGFQFYPRFIAPNELADALASTGWDACSTATNHGLDGGIAGIESTLNELDERGIGHSGTAREPDERLPSLYDVSGVTIAHLAFSQHYNGLRPPSGQEWAANVIDVDRILADARWAREQGAEFVVLSVSWGAEYTVGPIGYQRSIAEELLADPAIDLILGHHPHVVGPIDRIGDKYIVYSMGNHLSNQNSYWGPDYYATEDGLLVIAHVVERPGGFAVDSIEVVPTWVRLSDLRVYPAQEALAQQVSSEGVLTASIERTWERVTRVNDTGVWLSEQPFRAVACEGRRATILGTNGDDVLEGTDGDDVVVARGGADEIRTWAGNDLVCAGDGDDVVDTGYGIDRAWGGSGDDLLTSPGPLDTLLGGAGIDTCSATSLVVVCEGTPP